MEGQDQSLEAGGFHMTAPKGGRARAMIHASFTKLQAARMLHEYDHDFGVRYNLALLPPL